MKLQFEKRYYHSGPLTKEEELTYEKSVGTRWGIFDIDIVCSRKYKNGDILWLTYLDCPRADSKETITLCKTRGKLRDAIKATEEFLAEHEEV